MVRQESNAVIRSRCIGMHVVHLVSILVICHKSIYVNHDIAAKIAFEGLAIIEWFCYIFYMIFVHHRH